MLYLRPLNQYPPKHCRSLIMNETWSLSIPNTAMLRKDRSDFHFVNLLTKPQLLYFIDSDSLTRSRFDLDLNLYGKSVCSVLC